MFVTVDPMGTNSGRTRRGVIRPAAAVALACTLVVAGCQCTPDQPQVIDGDGNAAQAEQFARDLQSRIGTDAMYGHLERLQEIADRHDGNRAVGTAGYDASVDYVADALRERGFEVSTPEFEVRTTESEPGTVTAGDASFVARALQFSIGTDAQGITGPLVVLPTGDDSPGCTEDDYDGLDATGAVALVNRGKCPFAEKLAAATKRGVVAVVIADTVEQAEMGGTLGATTDVEIPVVSVTKADGAALRNHSGPVTLTINATVRDLTTRNIIAQTVTGSTSDVVMAGAHLDSVPEGPGINDNGSGVAAVLETALALGPEPPVANAVRFAFWGAEEVGLLGSQKYLEALDEDELRDIALYLNFDMVASPNPGYFTYDGDQSTTIARGHAVPRVPEGSAGIERLLVEYLESVDTPAQDTSFDGRSDYDGFTLAGIPSGGLFSGAEEKMSPEQAELWDGHADEPFDPNYHQAGDTLEHIDRTALSVLGPGVGYAVGRYAQDLRGRNGIPEHADRTRHLVRPE